MNEGKVECLECGKFFGVITPAHLINSHGMSIKEYKEKYPNAKFRGEATIARFRYAMMKNKSKILEKNENKCEEDQITDDAPISSVQNKIIELTDVVEEKNEPSLLKINLMELGSEIAQENYILNKLEKSPNVNQGKFPKLEELDLIFTKKIDEFKKVDIPKFDNSKELIPEDKLKILDYLAEVFNGYDVQNNYFIIKQLISGQYDYIYVTDISIPDLMINLEFPNSFWHNMDFPKVIRDENLKRDGWKVIDIDSRMPKIDDVKQQLLKCGLI